MKKFLNRIIINEIFSFINENHKNNNDSEKEFVARYATHIENDLKRGWSSWTFGNYGFHGTKEELKKAMQTAIDNNHEFSISGFDLWGDDIKKADIRELYPNYWVLVDNVNAKNGLSFIPLKSTNLKDAIIEAKNEIYSGEAVSYHPSEVKLVYSIDNLIHIFEVI